MEKEHMFDKVVTPSDQHAERYFPLDASTNEKGLLLNFEDPSGKPWRFRYSYWNSSQSYVMTKGWSRFVKEKRLDAGDTVSFGRGVGEAGRIASSSTGSAAPVGYTSPASRFQDITTTIAVSYPPM
ncbi:unnamed protein product [Spirodela intermedia]|uniref:TF-B3 domain-containing protein n=1 Tax=Spirodela intermedia TaxID=51605 RepID=A0A7I8IZP5_SPIIN|nr:unnamed protein product [Spirodela intermedia]CAA6663279.1 unnamed protein product [Spirodela intermedia]